MTFSPPVLVSCPCGYSIPVVGDPPPAKVQCAQCGSVLSVAAAGTSAGMDDDDPFLQGSSPSNINTDETAVHAHVPTPQPLASHHLAARGEAESVENSSSRISQPQQAQGAFQAMRGAMAVGMAGGMASGGSGTMGAVGAIGAMAVANDTVLSGNNGFGSSGATRLAGIDLAQRFTPSSETVSPQADDPGNAAIYGIHLIIRNHAKGGMGRIVVAYDQFLKREVALKELRPEVLDDLSVVHRFVSEAEITAQLEHPGIVPVHTLGLDADGHPYYTMKLIRGRTLQEAIKEYHKKPDDATLLWLVRRMVAASQPMAFAHERGVIHRDLKPANIMFGEHNETLVMDWGLAKVYTRPEQQFGETRILGSGPDAKTDGATKPKSKTVKTAQNATVSSKAVRPEPNVDNFSTPKSASLALMSGISDTDNITLAGTVVGTPAFMSPEQATPGATDVGPQTDVYGMGAILYTILTGRPPFTGKTGQEVLDKVRHQTAIPAVQLKKTVPEELSAICEKAMVRDLTQRYATIDEFSQDLCRWLDGKPVSAIPWTLWRQVVSWGRRWRFLGWIVLTLVLLLVADVSFFISRHALEDVERQHISQAMSQVNDLVAPRHAHVTLPISNMACSWDRREVDGIPQIHLVASGAGKVALLFQSPARDGAFWDFSDRQKLKVSLTPQSKEAGNIVSLEVKLGCGGSAFHYSLPAEHILTFGDGALNSVVIPLRPAEGSEWQREAIGTPSLTEVAWIELVIETTGDTIVDIQEMFMER